MKVAILLCTYNGENYLIKQIESCMSQTHFDVDLYISDDSSTDGTASIILELQQKYSSNKIIFMQGPRRGFAQNFLHLVTCDKIDANFFAFCDQDDIWKADKLARAVDAIMQESPQIPILYCSRMELIDTEDRVIGLSPWYKIKPAFENALLESISCGNTMVFNTKARNLLREASKNIDVPSHDWWTYIIVTGSGGKVIFDNYPSIYYRQHENNLVGMNYSFNARIERLQKFWNGWWSNMNDRNLLALRASRHLLTQSNKETYAFFYHGRRLSLFKRIAYIWRSNIYKKTKLGNLMLIMAVLFNKL